jgi:hypothetical protein
LAETAIVRAKKTAASIFFMVVSLAGIASIDARIPAQGTSLGCLKLDTRLAIDPRKRAWKCVGRLRFVALRDRFAPA